MPPYVYEMYRLVKYFGQNKVLDNINLAFYAGAKIGVVGDNGSGKSTLLRIMAGQDDNFQGHASPLKGVRVGYVPQEPQLDTTKTVRELIEESFSSTRKILDEYNAITEKMGEMGPDEMEKALDKMATLQDQIEAVDGWNLDTQIEKAADALFLPDFDQKVETLSGGERRRVALCKALLDKPDLLLLDEPTNHLDAETVAWLEKQLREYEGTVILITHDRYFLDNVTAWILELENTKGIPWEGNYTSWLDQKVALLDAEGKPSAKLAILKREQAWLKLSATDRSKWNMNHVLEYEKREQEAFEFRDSNNEIQIAPGPHLGNVVLELKGVSKSFGNRKLIDTFDLHLPRGAVVGVIGPNGVGKTTLFKMITGQEQPDAGTLRLGETVSLAYVDQHRDDLNNTNTVFQEIAGGHDQLEFGNQLVNARTYVGKFGFKGSTQQKEVGKLSGGERNRLHLAKLLRRGGNFLLLDEPTNDLDIATLRMLENAIVEFNGCAMVISHDRYFLDRICTHILAFEGNASIRWFEGNFAAYEAVRRKEVGAVYDRPRRSLYRSLT
ncbi:MAG: energy-dependent translational throttle protein EttA [bacterium]|nr:energy-dependent translational throttle protein EttA [bacterium]